MSEVKVYMAKFYKDVPIMNKYNFPKWIVPIQVGAALTEKKIADIADDAGENISHKNVNYCELTALYWIWKNVLCDIEDSNKEKYYGLFQYRRILDISENDIIKIKKNDIDAVLPFPMMCEPDIREHHKRYIKESDWSAMLRALKEIHPEYISEYEKYFSQPYMYNYNIIFAKANVLNDYCKWLFPILERTEMLSIPKGNERSDRYIGYLGESLLTLYFMSNKSNLKIAHTGRLMLK